jgi:uncharacterized damage-inducible protein DinB
MPDGSDGPRSELVARLHEVEKAFARQMQQRGFDPAQAENLALPGPLARLCAERNQLRAELAELEPEPRDDTLPGEPVNEIERIEDQLKRAFEGDAWHGPGVLEILAGVTAAQAAARPLPGAHGIWELVLHIAAWEGACRRRLAGDRAELSDEENWPSVDDTSEFAWEQARALLIDGHRRLRAAIRDTDESRLAEPILPGMPSVYVTLHGAVQHDLYHAGQIAILKKAASS